MLFRAKKQMLVIANIISFGHEVIMKVFIDFVILFSVTRRLRDDKMYFEIVP